MNHHILLQEIIQLAQAQALSVELSPITFHSVIWCIHLLYLIFEGAYIQMNWFNDIYIKGYLYQKQKVTLTRKIWNTLVEIDTYNTCTYGWYLYLCHNESYISFTKNCRTCSLDLIALMVWPCLGQIISLLSLLSLLIALNGLALHRFECSRENCLFLLLSLPLQHLFIGLNCADGLPLPGANYITIITFITFNCAEWFGSA